jgi:hypothetical protein
VIFLKRSKKVIIPDKYIMPSDSILYMSTIILKKLKNKKANIIDLWLEIKRESGMTYNKFMQILIYLNIIGVLNYTEKGEIYNENITS